jgi:hypothetical protein
VNTVRASSHGRKLDLRILILNDGGLVRLSKLDYREYSPLDQAKISMCLVEYVLCRYVH